MTDEQERFEERAAVREYLGGFSREEAERLARENLSNEALAAKFGVHVRTIEKVLHYESWGHVA